MKRLVKDRVWYRYWFNVLFCEVVLAVILVISGKPFWPPYLLLALIVGGILMGLLGTVKMRGDLGLPVIPRKPAPTTDYVATDSSVLRANEGNDSQEGNPDTADGH